MKRLLLIFDFDGVLVDSLDLVIRMTSEAAKRIGISGSTNAQQIAAMDQVTLPAIGALAGVPEHLFAEYSKEIFALLAEHAHQTSYFPGIAEALHKLAQSHTLAVVSANSKTVVSKSLEKAELSSLFSAIEGGETPGAKSEKIRKLMQTFGATAENTSMIGDSVSDISEGHLAGVRTVAVTWGWQPRAQLAKFNPQLFAESPQELLQLFPLTAG